MYSLAYLFIIHKTTVSSQKILSVSKSWSFDINETTEILFMLLI